jgi:hypothetical protein
MTCTSRCLYLKRMVDWVYQSDEGASLDDFFYFVQELGMVDLMGPVQGTVIQREIIDGNYSCDIGSTGEKLRQDLT